MEFNLADLFEHAADTWPEREYLVADGQRRTYAEMEARANRLAHHLAGQGIGPGDHVGIYGVNSAEWIESLWAIFKLRAVWININYRYVEDELAYLFGNADLKALVHDAAFTDRVDGVMAHMPDLRHRLVIGGDFEDAMAEGSPERDFAPRSPDDRYILYTGGTTGMPKGVVWRHEDVLFALGGGIDFLSGERATAPEDLVARGEKMGFAAHVPAHRPPHARRHPVGRDGPELPRQQGRADGPVLGPRRVAARRGGEGQLDDDDGRRHGPAAGRGAGRRAEQGP